ncbi:MAG: tetratricopeptide repeat protein, partial [Anaerolineae bacterium]|nr:tetratricopeptide repeat protein [Anaerolineae bacterium]
KRGIALSEETNNRGIQAIQLGNLGGIYYSLGEFETAVEYYHKGLNLSRELGDKLNQSRQLVNIGEVMSILKRQDEAIRYLKESIQLAQELNATSLLQNNWIFLACAYWLFGDFPRGLEAIHQALDMNHDNPDRVHYATILYGCLSWCHGDTEKATDIFRETIQITDTLLALAPDNFEALYSRALAWAGLWVATGDEASYQHAINTYRTAIQTSGSRGTLFEKHQLLKTLLACTDRDGTELLSLLA